MVSIQIRTLCEQVRKNNKLYDSFLCLLVPSRSNALFEVVDGHWNTLVFFFFIGPIKFAAIVLQEFRCSLDG